eukprot:10312721-Alexandrium_andersonii.AAC.1
MPAEAKRNDSESGQSSWTRRSSSGAAIVVNISKRSFWISAFADKVQERGRRTAPHSEHTT